jgi:hypothetical protein
MGGLLFCSGDIELNAAAKALADPRVAEIVNRLGQE